MRRSAGMRVLESIDEMGDTTTHTTNKPPQRSVDTGFVGDDGVDDEETILRVIGSPSSWSTPSNSPPRSGNQTNSRTSSWCYSQLEKTIEMLCVIPSSHITPSRCYPNDSSTMLLITTI